MDLMNLVTLLSNQSQILSEIMTEVSTTLTTPNMPISPFDMNVISMISKVVQVQDIATMTSSKVLMLWDGLVLTRLVS